MGNKKSPKKRAEELGYLIDLPPRNHSEYIPRYMTIYRINDNCDNDSDFIKNLFKRDLIRLPKIKIIEAFILILMCLWYELYVCAYMIL